MTCKNLFTGTTIMKFHLIQNRIHATVRHVIMAHHVTIMEGRIHVYVHQNIPGTVVIQVFTKSRKKNPIQIFRTYLTNVITSNVIYEHTLRLTNDSK